MTFLYQRFHYQFHCKIALQFDLTVTGRVFIWKAWLKRRANNCNVKKAYIHPSKQQYYEHLTMKTEISKKFFNKITSKPKIFRRGLFDGGFVKIFASDASGPRKANWNLILVTSHGDLVNFWDPSYIARRTFFTAFILGTQLYQTLRKYCFKESVFPYSGELKSMKLKLFLFWCMVLVLGQPLNVCWKSLIRPTDDTSEEHYEHHRASCYLKC